MNDLNKIEIIGRLTKDIGNQDFAYISTGTAKLNISIASNQSQKRNGNWEDVASFFDVVIWGKTAENLKPYLNKGKQIAIVGHLMQDRWKDQNGNNRSKVYIVAEEVQLLGGNDKNVQKAESYNRQPQPEEQSSDFQEDIPF